MSILLHISDTHFGTEQPLVVALQALARERHTDVLVFSGDITQRTDRLRGAEHALQDWSRAGADLVLGGHIHLPSVMDLSARPQPTPGRCGACKRGRRHPAAVTLSSRT